MIALTETGIMGLHRHGSEMTDIFRLILTSRGWDSKYLFRIDRVINRLELDADRLIVDHQIYSMKGELLQTMVKNVNNFQLKVQYPDGIISGVLALGDDIIVCGQHEYTRFTIYKWNGR